MSSIQKCLWTAAALAAAFVAAPDTASARGPIRYAVARPVLRTPVAVVRTARVTPPYVPYYYTPRVYVPRPYYHVAPVIYIY